METEGYHPLDQAVQAAMKARAALRAGRLRPDDPRLRLSARQFRGMRALKSGKRPEDVAAELGVPLELVGRWLATPVSGGRCKPSERRRCSMHWLWNWLEVDLTW